MVSYRKNSHKGLLGSGLFPLYAQPSVRCKCDIKSFQNYIAKDEEDVVAEVLKENFDADELIDVVDRFGCRKVPTKENARDFILEVAHK